jgi:hypothetical protein
MTEILINNDIHYNIIEFISSKVTTDFTENGLTFTYHLLKNNVSA